jgi:GT2 family glycosyltransferase
MGFSDLLASSFWKRKLVIFRSLSRRLKRLASSYRGGPLWFACGLSKLLFKKAVLLFAWRGKSYAQEDLPLFLQTPLFSLILVARDNLGHLKKTLASIQGQSYPHWELCLAGSAPETGADPRIKIAPGGSEHSMALLWNRALGIASGEYLLWLDAGDTLAKDALYELVKKIHFHPEADLLYSDEEGLLKPDWCPDTFLSKNYLGRMLAIRRKLALQVGGLREDFEGALELDFLLRATETNKIVHIRKNLYHRLIVPPAEEGAAARALSQALARRGVDAKVEPSGSSPGCFTIRYRPQTGGRVTIIIPTKDKRAVLKKCIDSIYAKTLYPNWELLVVSNNSSEKELFTLLEGVKKVHGDTFHYYESNRPFNYSALMNEAASRASGEHLLFLNNDTEVISPDWIGEMVGQSERAEIGAVGCKLLYFDQTIQHAGIIVGLKERIETHAFRGEMRNCRDANRIRNASALTGACLMCKKELFYKIGGFEENLAIAFNDVDLCLRLRELGVRHVYLPHVELYHHESLTRGSPLATKESSKQLEKETALMRDRWAKYLGNDPCYVGN